MRKRRKENDEVTRSMDVIRASIDPDRVSLTGLPWIFVFPNREYVFVVSGLIQKINGRKEYSAIQNISPNISDFRLRKMKNRTSKATFPPKPTLNFWLPIDRILEFWLTSSTTVPSPRNFLNVHD